jgi:type I restriction enzyme S subunit
MAFPESIRSSKPIEGLESTLATLGELADSDRPICYGILMPGRGYVGGVPVIKVKDIMFGRIDESDLLLTSPELDEEYRRSRLRTGDLLITIRGTTGRVAAVPKSLDRANITQDTARVSISDITTRDYIFYCLQTQALQDQIQHHTIGQAVKGINIEEVRKLKIALPDAAERAAIVKVLQSVDTRLDAETTLYAQLTRQKSALSQGLLTGRIQVKGVA